MNILLLSSAIFIDASMESQLRAQGHWVHKAYHNSGKQDNTIAPILEALPEGFVPDVTVVWSADYNGIPLDIENMPGRTIIQVNDFHLAYSSLYPHLSRFDAIWTDKRGVEVFKERGFNHFIDSPLYPYAANIPEIDMPEKDIDVIFVGANNHVVHWERSLWLRRLCRLGDKHKVLVTGNVYGPDYHKTLARGKIVFNQGIRREMNMRCFEAGMLEGLLFMEKGNLECPEYFPEGVGAVYYDENNLEQLIDHYLKNENERQKIVSYAKNQSEKMLRNQIFQFIEQAEKLDTDPSVRKFRDNRTDQHKKHLAVNTMYRFNKRTDAVAKKLFEEATKINPHDAETWNNLAVMEMREAKRCPEESRMKFVENALAYFDKSIQVDPNYIPSRVSLGNLFFDLNLNDKAEAWYTQAYEALHQGVFTPRQFEGLGYPAHFDYMRMHREHILCQSEFDEMAGLDSQKNLFLLRVCEGVGRLKAKARDYDNSMQFLLEGLEYSEKLNDPIPTLFSALSDVTWEMGDSEASIVYGTRYDELAPFDLEAWDKLLGRLLDARMFTQAHEKATEYWIVSGSYSFAQEKREQLQNVLDLLNQAGPAWGHWEQAVAALRCGDTKNAALQFQNAAEVLIKHPPFAMDLGLFLLSQNQFELAEKCFEVAQQDPAQVEEATQGLSLAKQKKSFAPTG